jgi:2,3-bisphosphoglycerate-independent phosphoglycerate mutase
MTSKPLVLIVLDGFGERAERDANAVKLACTPVLDRLRAEYPSTTIGTSGPDVGLPPGQMGNSEVGHLNFGAGRVAMMDISKIDNAIHAGLLGSNAVIHGLIERAASAGGALHLIGLVSDGGVHSSLAHLLALIDLARGKVRVVVHAFTDGRDVAPGSAVKYVAALEAKVHGVGVIGTVSGRFYGMDRDERWERVALAYHAIEGATGNAFASASAGIEASYADGKTDEFIVPFVVAGYAGIDASKDVALHINFRPDRARELTVALTSPSFDSITRLKGAPFERIGSYACMTTYDRSLPLPVAFPKDVYEDIFPEVISRAKLTQFRCAETEKYAHVTYFFNGGREEPFAGESRKLIPSPKDVATYDLKPQMSASAVSSEVCLAIKQGSYDFVLVNFANPDMVGHTGVLDAATHAVEAVDEAVGQVVEATLKRGGAVIISADHGNCELMVDPETGMPHTAHTTNRVPLIYVNPNDAKRVLRAGGRLCDVAPMMLSLLGLPQPAAMTGKSLFLP